MRARSSPQHGPTGGPGARGTMRKAGVRDRAIPGVRLWPLGSPWSTSNRVFGLVPTFGYALVGGVGTGRGAIPGTGRVGIPGGYYTGYPASTQPWAYIGIARAQPVLASGSAPTMALRWPLWTSSAHHGSPHSDTPSQANKGEI